MSANTDPDPIDVEVGGRIRIRRKSLRLSQSALAEARDLTFQQVQKYERGSNRVSASMLVKIAAKLETSVGALVGENDADRHSHDVYQRLAAAGALQLLDAYSRLPDPQTRRAVVHLVEAMAPERVAELTAVTRADAFGASPAH
jgi:transcriptional regulator with XRE-family HTH domain